MVLPLTRKSFICISLLLLSFNCFAFIHHLLPEKISYKSQFNNCPSNSAGKFVLKLTKIFDKEKSLYELKKEIKEKDLQKKYFISKYDISLEPISGRVTFKLTCPEALAKVTAFNEEGKSVLQATLVEGAKLYDPTYEVLLRGEKIIKAPLPVLAIPAKLLDEKIQQRVSLLVAKLDRLTRKYLSEIILNENKELTVIFSYKGRPSSVFFGQNDWEEKNSKLIKMFNYMHQNSKMPKIVNMTNIKKVVVKF